MLPAFDALSAKPPASALASVVDEETGFCGAAALAASGFRAGGCVLGEPAGLRLVVVHKGAVRGYIRVVGAAAHTPSPGEDISTSEG